LRISHGQRYALIGRNGSGKSSLLERIANGSLPGFPQHLRVSILHQMDEQLSGSGLRAVDACLQLGAQSRRWDLEDEREQLQAAMSLENPAEETDMSFIVQVRALRCEAQIHDIRCSDWVTSSSSWRSSPARCFVFEPKKFCED
jgi:ATPase subunit of ABC transporter with duplicated ATPase domains